MKEKTIIRMAQLVVGCYALTIHAIYSINHILLLIIAVLWGIPLDIILEKREKK